MLANYLRLLARRWWLVLLPAVVVLGYSLITYRSPAQAYQVAMRFAAGLPPEQTSGVYNFDRQYVWLASEYIANGLSDVAHTGLFAEAVANRANANGLNVTPGQIQGAIASDQKQSIFVVYVTWPDATQIMTIANAITAELSENAAAYWPQLANARVSPAKPLDDPTPAPIAPPLRDRFDLPVRVLLALAAGLALTLLAHYADPFIHERRDLDRLGLPVIGEIPFK